MAQPLHILFHYHHDLCYSCDITYDSIPMFYLWQHNIYYDIIDIFHEICMGAFIMSCDHMFVLWAICLVYVMCDNMWCTCMACIINMHTRLYMTTVPNHTHLIGFVRRRKRKRSYTSRGREPRRMKRSECCWLWRNTFKLRALMEWRVVIQTQNWEEGGYQTPPRQEFEHQHWVDNKQELSLLRNDAGMLVGY